MTVGVFFLVLVGLMLLGVPVAFSLGIASAGYMIAEGTSLAMVVQRMVSGANSFTMLAIPFFFMAGELMNISGVTDKIITMAKALVGHMKGGLAQVNIVASVFFAGVSGSATADTAALGSSLIPAMVKEGYDLDFSAAITVASSCVGPIIPPSITLVLYGILSGADVAHLLIAGVVPGIVIAAAQMIYTHFYAVKMNYPSYSLHASECGTSVMMYLYPELVDHEEITCVEAKPNPFPDVLQYEHFTEKTPNGSIGDSTVATREKGEAIVNTCVERIMSYLDTAF